MSALTPINLYTGASMSHTGTKDTGNGIGLPSPSPLFSTYKAYAIPPNGINNSAPPADCWIHGGYLYLLDNYTGGSGVGIYRFLLNASDPMGMTYDSHVAIGSLLAGANRWTNWGAAVYDATDGCVFLFGYNTSGTGNTPIAGKWSLSTGWPWAAGNAAWLSGLTQSYGSYQAGQVTDEPIPYVAESNVYVASSLSGQVHTLSKSTGAVTGPWVTYAGRSATYRLNLFGELGSTPIACGRYTWPVRAYDNTDPANWVTSSTIYPDNADVSGYYQPWKRTIRRFHGGSTKVRPAQRHELDLLGFGSDVCGFFVGRRYSYYEDIGLTVFKVDGSGYKEFPLAANSGLRGPGTGGFFYNLRRVTSHGGMPWLVDISRGTQDQEEEDPGGNCAFHIGLMATPLGPGTCRFSLTASASGDPKRLSLSMDTAAKDYNFSADPRKVRARYQLNAGGFSDWRSGPRELDHLDSVVNGKAAWSSYSGGDSIDVEIQLVSGWPYDWGGDVIGNPGAVGDPATEAPGILSCSPPREIVPTLWVLQALSQEGLHQGIVPESGWAENVRPVGLYCEDVT